MALKVLVIDDSAFHRRTLTRIIDPAAIHAAVHAAIHAAVAIARVLPYTARLNPMPRRTLACLLSFARYAGAAVIFTWPLATRLSTHVLGTLSGDTGVYIWNLWSFGYEVSQGTGTRSSPPPSSR